MKFLVVFGYTDFPRYNRVVMPQGNELVYFYDDKEVARVELVQGLIYDISTHLGVMSVEAEDINQASAKVQARFSRHIVMSMVMKPKDVPTLE